MNMQRINKLIKCLEEPFEETFDMGQWVKKTDCGTSCCAYGLYFLKHPEENPPGKLREVPFPDSSKTLTFNSDFPLNVILGEHFGITQDQSADIFMSSAYPRDPDEVTPAQVIERIRKELFR